MMNWESIKNNDVDLHLEQWTDTIPTYDDDVRAGRVINLGIIVEDSCQAVYVPRYVVEGDPSRGLAPLAPDLRRLEDLINYPHLFPDDENPSKGRFYGAVPGWTADVIMYNRFLYLGLDKVFNYLRLGSESALFMSLEAAFNLGEPWVGYCWEPAWIIGKVDVIRLEDVPFETAAMAVEGKTGFSTQALTIECSRDFPAKAPDIAEFLKKYRTGKEYLNEALAYLIDTGDSYDTAAIWFIKKYDHLIDDWLPAENAKKLREYLSQR
jgi:glycine betaine/proline transport system permease protein/glycine betaine/proline transport system substrate-binding protein